MIPFPPRADDEVQKVPTPDDSDSESEYVLLEANSRQALQQLVNTYLRQGWRLQGGVAVATTGAMQWWYYQAVVGE
jgi:hypothetical protein